MTITQALQILRGAPEAGEPFGLLLACSFSPLHLQTLVTAHVQQRMPNKRVCVTVGEFGDLTSTVERASEQETDAVAIVLEWQDIDPRFAYREAGAWGPALETDVLRDTGRTLDRLEAAVEKASDKTRIGVCLPALPLVPAFRTPEWQAGSAELFLNEQVFAFARRLSQKKNVTIINPAWVSEAGVPGSRLDLKSELLIGFPYTVPHADRIADGFARVLAPSPALKGIITDLDDTLWSGLVGEIGADAVRWDAASRYHLHGLYQKLLSALADEGILVGVASKNDPSVVQAALSRNDLLIAPKKIFPVEVHWAPKSESVTRILKRWNISADAVAFVDDTPLELAEVANVHPGITCIQFPTGDYKGVLEVLKRLRGLCSKDEVTAEDALRLESIRAGAVFEEQTEHAASAEALLSQIGAKLSFDFDISPSNGRALELVNKTNQFNLNGVRFTQPEWERKLAQPGSFLISVKYEDKFGPLGAISVIQGFNEQGNLHIATWVMSCRAFARRIEHQCLKVLFERFDSASMSFQFASTAKNGPLREFFKSMLGYVPDEEFWLGRDQFSEACPALYHEVEQNEGVTVDG